MVIIWKILKLHFTNLNYWQNFFNLTSSNSGILIICFLSPVQGMNSVINATCLTQTLFWKSTTKSVCAMVHGVPGIWQRRSDFDPRLVCVRFVLENVITGILIYQKQFSQHSYLCSVQIMPVFTINCMYQPKWLSSGKICKIQIFCWGYVVAQLAEALHYGP